MTVVDPSTSSDASGRWRAPALSYPLLCTLLGLVIGWAPFLIHGPHPQKFDLLYIKGALAVWGFYLARLLIGVLVGLTSWPRQWYLRGPMCGLIMMLPLGIVVLATPRCGWP